MQISEEDTKEKYPNYGDTYHNYGICRQGTKTCSATTLATIIRSYQ